MGTGSGTIPSSGNTGYMGFGTGNVNVPMVQQQRMQPGQGTCDIHVYDCIHVNVEDIHVHLRTCTCMYIMAFTCYQRHNM